MRDRQTPAARATKAGGGAEARRAGFASCNSARENEIKGPPPVARNLLVGNTNPSRLNQCSHQSFIYPPPPRYFTPSQKKKKKREKGKKREGGRKFTAIITLHQHTQISLFFLLFFFLPFRLKGALLLSFKDMQISPSLPHLHFNKLALLNALGRIKVEVRFECIQRRGSGGLGGGRRGGR